jgi:hypothetical protein
MFFLLVATSSGTTTKRFLLIMSSHGFLRARLHITIRGTPDFVLGSGLLNY